MILVMIVLDALPVIFSWTVTIKSFGSLTRSLCLDSIDQ